MYLVGSGEEIYIKTDDFFQKTYNIPQTIADLENSKNL
jgi:hypothetical protein